MSKELEEIKSLVFTHFGALGFYNPSMNDEIIRDRDKVLKYLDSLEAIDNANPSEALESWNKIGDILNKYCNDKGLKFSDSYNIGQELQIIKQALVKSQEQEKVLKIIFEKGLSLAERDMIKQSENYEQYCIKFGWCYMKNAGIQKTEEEFKILKEVLTSE